MDNILEDQPTKQLESNGSKKTYQRKRERVISVKGEKERLQAPSMMVPSSLKSSLMHKFERNTKQLGDSS